MSFKDRVNNVVSQILNGFWRGVLAETNWFIGRFRTPGFKIGDYNILPKFYFSLRKGKPGEDDDDDDSGDSADSA